ncbi:HK97 gp10 family phage protein [Fictibacillus sp. Mic-4]|uniref:HK97 gp10 family phage protein n=1 Tax=Fictibacillus sp. Mic-4 TaxID=3132826 RepID=UPI003CF0DC27
MAKSFELDVSGLKRLMASSPEAAARGAKRGLHDALDDWVREARNIAPIDKGTLRRGITAEGVTGKGINLKAEINSTAIERGFNYAYYIHEEDAGGKNVNGEKQYLDKSAQENQTKWQRWIEEEIVAALKNEGW